MLIIIIFYHGCWWFQMPTLHEPFITIPPLSHPHLMSEGCLCFSISPLPRPAVTETSAIGNILQPSKEDELLQLCLALYWSAASLALFHENTLLSKQADTYIFQCWVQLPYLLTLTMETTSSICWEKHWGIILYYNLLCRKGLIYWYYSIARRKP